MFELRAAPEGRPIGYVPAHSATPGCYSVQVFGDELYPTVRHGSCLVIEPQGRCHEGELMLLQLVEQQYIVCELVAQDDSAVTWVPAIGGPRRTTAADRVAAMHPIVDVIPASRLVNRAG